MDREKLQTHASTCTDCIQLALCITMVIVGAQYNGQCFVDVPLYLMLGGGITLALIIAKRIAILTPCDCDDKLVKFLTPIAGIVLLCVTLWGSVIVFGNYSSWSYEKQELPTPRPDIVPVSTTIAPLLDENNHYCPYTPYMFAFVLLIINWILIPIIFCCSCMAVCALLVSSDA